MKTLAKSLVGGVIIQTLIFAGLLMTGEFMPRNPEGSLQSLSESIFIAFILLSPGLMVFGPTGTARNPHPPFSGFDIVLVIIVNIVAYSIVVCLGLKLWRSLKTRLTKTT